MVIHDLHQAVAKAIEIVSDRIADLEVEFDEACEENNKLKKRLPFFLTNEAHNDTEITNVDLMILKGNKVKLVCEIEESDITPTRTFGKIFSVASAKMSKLKDGTRYNLDQNGVFVQVLSSKKINKDNSKKISQGFNIEKAINELLNSQCSWIKKYYLIYGDVNSFNEGNDGFLKIEKIIKSL